MSEMERILVAIDFSESSRTALHRAFMQADRCGASLEVAHVIQSSLLEHIGLPASEVRDNAERRLGEFLAGVSGVSQRSAINTGISVLEGNPASVLAERATTTGADLIVVGAHGGNFLRDLFAEPTAMTMLRRHAKPVLMVKRTPSRDYRRIVVATDFSVAALAAGKTAARLAPDADLRALHIFEATFEGKMRYANCSAETIDRHRVLAEIDAVSHMRAFTSATEPMTGFRGVVRHGHVLKEIQKYAEEERADLLVLGVPRRSAISSLLFSSVTSHLVQSPSPDLLLVPYNDE